MDTFKAENEIWKDIQGFEGLYQISNQGNVRSLDRVTCDKDGNPVSTRKGQPMKQTVNRYGYKTVRLSKNGSHEFWSVHRLVAIAFIPNPYNKPQVNHIDGNKQNNTVENLEWVTNSENLIHAYRTGLYVHSEKQRQLSRERMRKLCEMRKKWVVQLDAVTGDYINCFQSISDANETMGFPRDSGHIGQVCKGIREFCHGYKWQYYDNYITGNVVEYKGQSRKYPEKRNGAITVQEREEVVEKYKAGESITDLSQEYDVNKMVIRDAIKKANISIDRVRETKYKIDLTDLLNDFKAGLSNKELIEKYKCTRKLISARKYQFRKAGKLD